MRSSIAASLALVLRADPVGDLLRPRRLCLVSRVGRTLPHAQQSEPRPFGRQKVGDLLRCLSWTLTLPSEPKSAECG